MRTFRHLPYILNINFLANINHHQHSSTTLPLLPFIWANHFDIVSTNWKDPLNPRATALSVMMMRWTWSFIHSFHANILSQSQRCRHFGCSCGDDGDGTFWGNSSASFDRPFFFLVWASRRLTGQEVWGAVGALLVFQFFLHLNWRQGPATKIFETTSNSTELTSYSKAHLECHAFLVVNIPSSHIF